MINAKIDFEWKIIGENVSIYQRKFFQDNLGFLNFTKILKMKSLFSYSSLIKHFVGSDL